MESQNLVKEYSSTITEQLFSKTRRKTKQCLRRMRWKAYFLLNLNATSPSKGTYGFKSTKNSPIPLDRQTKGIWRRLGQDDAFDEIQASEQPFPEQTERRYRINAIERKPSFSSRLTKQRTFTNWNRQHTAPYLNKTSSNPAKKQNPIPHGPYIQKTKTLLQNWASMTGGHHS